MIDCGPFLIGICWRKMLLAKARKANLDESGPIRVAAANFLQDAILKGELRPGQEIPQQRLSQQMGFSQSSLREALQELETRGLIMKSGRSWTVTQLSLDDLADIYQIRAVLEPAACRLAASHWSQALNDKLEDLIKQMHQAARDKDYFRHAQADMEFHRTIWSCQPNRLFEKHLNLVCMRLWAYDLVERCGCAYLNFDRSLRQHRTILNVLNARDGVRVEKVVRRLIDRFHHQDIVDFNAIREAGDAETPGEP
jgi:DNA-binding GntR family transcriptional regulator